MVIEDRAQALIPPREGAIEGLTMMKRAKLNWSLDRLERLVRLLSLVGSLPFHSA
jgi:hypothetical protein